MQVAIQHSPDKTEKLSLQFVHLRCHSEFSIVDGIVRIDDYVAKANKDAMPALALTDLSNLFGAIKFYKAARSKGIKPIIGCDVWLENSQNRDQAHRALLLVQNHAGYLQLCALISRAYLENQYRGRAELKPEWLNGLNGQSSNDKSTEGLILISGNAQSDIGAALIAGNISLAEKLAKQWSNAFPNRLYIELQRVYAPTENSVQEKFIQQESVIHHALDLASTLGLPVLATHPIQFIAADDFMAHEARTCISEGYMLADSRRPKSFTPEQYFKTQAQMCDLFADIPGISEIGRASCRERVCMLV